MMTILMDHLAQHDWTTWIPNYLKLKKMIQTEMLYFLSKFFELLIFISFIFN